MIPIWFFNPSLHLFVIVYVSWSDFEKGLKRIYTISVDFKGTLWHFDISIKHDKYAVYTQFPQVYRAAVTHFVT